MATTSNKLWLYLLVALFLAYIARSPNPVDSDRSEEDEHSEETDAHSEEDEQVDLVSDAKDPSWTLEGWLESTAGHLSPACYGMLREDRDLYGHCHYPMSLEPYYKDRIEDGNKFWICDWKDCSEELVIDDLPTSDAAYDSLHLVFFV